MTSTLEWQVVGEGEDKHEMLSDLEGGSCKCSGRPIVIFYY